MEESLLHVMELVVEEDRARLLVGAEETFNGHPEFPGGLLAFHGEVEDGVIDGRSSRLGPSRGWWGACITDNA